MAWNGTFTWTVYNVLTVAQLQQITDDLLVLRGISSNIEISASALMPTATNGCGFPARTEFGTHGHNMVTCAFPASALSQAEFEIPDFPGDWDVGTLQAKFIWTCNATTTGTVIWFIEGWMAGDNESLDPAAGTERYVSDANQSVAYQNLISGNLGTNLTLANAGAGKTAHFRVYRKATGDTLAVDALLKGVILTYTRT